MTYLRLTCLSTRNSPIIPSTALFISTFIATSEYPESEFLLRNLIASTSIFSHSFLRALSSLSVSATKIIFFLVLSLPSVASEAENALNDAVTNILRQNWPYEAFLAIPRISEMRPTLAIEISKKDSSSYTSSCIEIFYSELQKKFESKTLLDDW